MRKKEIRKYRHERHPLPTHTHTHSYFQEKSYFLAGGKQIGDVSGRFSIPAPTRRALQRTVSFVWSNLYDVVVAGRNILFQSNYSGTLHVNSEITRILYSIYISTGI